ncbi:MAG: hypothetical protein WCO45_10545 [Pseudanabaena sp. ELA607]|jgi:hypothetical protein
MSRSKVKHTLKTLGAQTYQALSEAIESAFAEVSETNKGLVNYFV